jgi:hypothetical protein
MENKKLILKALTCYRSHKYSNLKNAKKNGRMDIANERFKELIEIDELIIELKD